MKLPQLVCENCGYKNQLDFKPLKDFIRLETVKCEECKGWAYWTHYYNTLGEIIAAIKAFQKKYVLDYIHKGRPGHKKSHSTSL